LSSRTAGRSGQRFHPSSHAGRRPSSSPPTITSGRAATTASIVTDGAGNVSAANVVAAARPDRLGDQVPAADRTAARSTPRRNTRNRAAPAYFATSAARCLRIAAAAGRDSTVVGERAEPVDVVGNAGDRLRIADEHRMFCARAVRRVAATPYTATRR
jgi:hypothetical protein